MAENEQSIIGKVVGLFEARAKQQEIEARQTIEVVEHPVSQGSPKTELLEQLRKKHAAEKKQARLNMLRDLLGL